MTYSGMACGHTTIGAERFHFRVRNGIGWFPFAIAARQTGKIFDSTLVAFANDARNRYRTLSAQLHHPHRQQSNALRLYGQVSRAISTG